ncbi:23666_t:CDS:2 [Racocetra persica]|uniref:23666_t:CDS:1 n=1 Tax=Racocetra persica TaxID=160502 RepID=A0ACA9NVK4_9GLOM|nr:23666_t:CDS:2 [Racocetra persica]
MPDLPKYSETGGYNLGSHNIKSAKLENDKLIIEYNNNQQTETKDINDAELEKIKSYSQKIGKSELSLSDLESSLNTGSPDNKIKDWGRGRLSGNLNHEYLEWSYKVGKQRRYERHRMYSPFYQNETHENKKTVFENKHLWVKNGYNRNIVDLLAHCERKETELPFFEQLKEKVGKEIFTPEKSQRHRAWSKSVKERKELERSWVSGVLLLWGPYQE